MGMSAPVSRRGNTEGWHTATPSCSRGGVSAIVAGSRGGPGRVQTEDL